mgnify:CR=1 FL=1
MGSKPCVAGCPCGRHRPTHHSEETRLKISVAKMGVSIPHTEETRQKMSASRLGMYRGVAATGHYYHAEGYRYLTGRHDHPLASHGAIAEHRMVLYDAIGPGPHPCNWCGELVGWGGRDGIHADHLNGDALDNSPENLVPSCNSCNHRRSMAGNPTEWNP